MSRVRLRPTFTIPLSGSREVAMAAIRERLASDDRFAGRWRGKGRWAEIHVPHVERRLWSPHLSLRLDEEPDGCSLFGRFAPHPEVWTLFMFLYFALAFAVVFGGVFGYVQWASDERPWALWTVGVGLPAIALIHVAGAVGQRLGYGQMVRLKAELDEVLRGL